MMMSSLLAILIAATPQAAAAAPVPSAPASVALSAPVPAPVVSPAAPAPVAPAASSPTPNNPPPPPKDSPADLGYLSAGALVDRCSESSSASTSYCFAYIAGVSDAMRAYEIWLNTREFCPPLNQSQSDLRRAFVGYVTAYPSNSTGQAASVVVVALKQTYPCMPDPVVIPPAATPAPTKTPNPR